MDWAIIYQITALLALTLLAIVITIFVFASSLLGLAVESAAKEENDSRAAQDREIQKQVEQAKKDLNQAAEGTGEFRQADKTLRKLINQKDKFEKETRRIRQGYEVFKTKGGVLYPGILLLISVVLSTLAWGFSTGTHQSASLWLWGFGLAVLGFGLYRIYLGLKKIESVAVTSEQAALTRMTRALGTALEKHDEVTKPEVRFVFEGGGLPFHCKKESTLEVKLDLTLMKGDIVERVEVLFFAPQGFSFPNREMWSQDSDYWIASACTCRVIVADILFGVTRVVRLELKAPAQTGTFTLAYSAHYSGWKGKLEKFEVVVE